MTPFTPNNINDLTVTDPSSGFFVPEGGGQVEGFNGAISPMLTVWRKLHLEFDSMPAVPTAGPEKNFWEAKVKHIVHNPGGVSTVWLPNDALAGVDFSALENGELTLGGIKYPIVNNRWFSNVPWISVQGAPPLSQRGQIARATDDDGRFMTGEGGVGLAPILPSHNWRAVNPDEYDRAFADLRRVYSAAYIDVRDANAAGWNSRNTIAFNLNLGVNALNINGNLFRSAKDLFDSNEFWAHTVSFGFQSGDVIEKDGDFH